MYGSSGFEGGENQRLRNENNRLNRYVIQLESQTGVDKIKADAAKQVDSARKETVRFHDFWQSAKIKLVQTERRVKDLLAENKTLKETRNRLESLVEKLKKDNAKKDKKIDKLNDDVRILEGKRQKQESEIAEQSKKIMDLQQQVQKYEDKKNVDGVGNGVPTGRMGIGQKKVIPATSRGKGYKHRGGVEGHPGHYLKPLKDEQVEKVVTHLCTQMTCKNCHVQLEDKGYEDHDIVDAIVITVGIRHRFMIKICPCCGKIYKEEVPEKIKYPCNYGPSMKAQLVWNMIVGNVSMNKDVRYISGVTDGVIAPSEGYMAKLVKQAAEALRPFRNDLRIVLLDRPLLFWDDTVIMISTHSSCLRFYGDENIAFYIAHRHKDAQSLDEDGILQFLSEETHVMHDHNIINYNEKYKFTNIECVVHLKRDDTKYIIVAHHDAAQRFSDLISNTIDERKKLVAEGIYCFTEEQKAKISREIDEIVNDWEKEAENDANCYYHDTEMALIRRIRKYKKEYFAWVEDFTLPTSNSLSERALRIAKSKTKISGQFYSETTADYYALILSYVETCHRCGKNEIDALTRLFEGNPYSIHELFPEEYLTNYGKLKKMIREATGVQISIPEEPEGNSENTVDNNSGAVVCNPTEVLSREEVLKKVLEGYVTKNLIEIGVPGDIQGEECTNTAGQDIVSAENEDPQDVNRQFAGKSITIDVAEQPYENENDGKTVSLEPQEEVCSNIVETNTDSIGLLDSIDQSDEENVSVGVADQLYENENHGKTESLEPQGEDCPVIVKMDPDGIGLAMKEGVNVPKPILHTVDGL